MSSIVIHYGAPQSRALTILWALEELGLPYDKVRYELPRGEHKTDALRKLNPNGKVPTIVIDGTPMFESLAILLYLGERYGVDKKLYPATTEPARLEAMAWATWATVTLGVDLMRVIEASNERIPAERHNAAQAAAARADVGHDLGILEARLEGRSFITGESFCLADCMLGAALGFAMRSGAVDVSRFPRAGAYAARITGRPAFGRATQAQA
jgi:glutathione S-transferase